MTDVDPSWLLTKLESIGVPNANAVAQAYAKGDTGELLRALVLREIWVWAIDSWRDQPDQLDKFARDTSARDLELFTVEPVMPDAWVSLRRLLDNGTDRRDLALAARGIAYVTAFSVLYALNGGTTGSAADELWDLIPDDFQQANALWSLHELLLSADPTGRNSSPPSDAAE